MPALVEVKNLMVEFDKRSVVDDVSFTCTAGEVCALVGESGSGKSTIARAIVGLNRPTSGVLCVDGTEQDWPHRHKGFGSTIQMVFQDPYSTLDPGLPVWRSVSEPIEINSGGSRRSLKQSAADLLAQVELDPALTERRPAELSGGQRQRVAIARALSLEPRLLVCDEAVSALDVTTQAAIVRLLEGLRRDRDLSILFISHDLNTVKEFADDVLVLNAGKIVESGPPEQIFADPQDQYTQRLIAAIPTGDPNSRKRLIHIR